MSSRLERQAVRGVLWTVLQSSASRLVGLLVFIVLARLLQPQDFGAVAMTAVFMALLDNFSDQGFSVALVQRPKLDEEHIASAFWVNLLLGCACASVFVLCTGWIAQLYHSPLLRQIIPPLSLVLPINSLATVPTGLLQRELRYKEIALSTMLSAFVGGLFGIAAAFMHLGALALVIQQITTASVFALCVWICARYKPVLLFSWAHLREVWGFSLYLLGSSFLDFVSKRGDDFLVGLYLGQTALGLYVVAYRALQVFIQLIAKAGSNVALSAFSRLTADHAALRKALYEATRSSNLVAMPVCVGIAVLAPVLVPLVFGQHFRESGPILRILILIGIIHSVTYYDYAVYVATGKPDIRLKMLVLHTAANIAGFYVAVRLFASPRAVAAAFVIRGYVLFPLDLIVLRKMIGISIRKYLGNFVPCLIASTGMAAVSGLVLFLPLHPVFIVLIAASLGPVTYFLILARIAPDSLRTLINKISDASRKAPEVEAKP